MFSDLREFLKEAEELGELKHINEADPDLDVGGLTELMAERSGPALLFDGLKGYPKGFRILCNPYLSDKRTSLALGLPLDSAKLRLVQAWRTRLKDFKLAPPLEVKDGPVRENIHKGEKVDLNIFPSPQWHEDDGGKYVGTGSVCILKDPDSDWTNLGIYRIQIHEQNLAGIQIEAHTHGRIILEKYWERGLSCPIAVAIGVDPATFVSAIQRVPIGVSEYDYAGWIRGSPVEVMIGESSGLLIPVNSEIVIEGEIPPQEKEARDEGPFGEFTGYYAGGVTPKPVLKVKSIMHRNDPILHGAPPLRPPQTNNLTFDIVGVPRVWDELDRSIRDVKGVWSMLLSGDHIVVVSISQKYAGHAKQAGLLVAGLPLAINRFVIVVDDDIDPSNNDEVLWALASRVDPQDSIDIIRDCLSTPLDSIISPDKRSKGEFTTSKAVINACRPWSWRKEFPKDVRSSAELREKTLKKWKDLFSES
ncbi:MAG: UbiD family decarboxylase [Nitrososphaerales archaeon]